MNIARIFKRIWYGPPVIAAAEELAPGAALVEGTVHASKETLSAPLTSTPCVAFRYRAVYRTPTRGGSMERVLKDVEVFAESFDLNIGGTRIPVEPVACGSFTLEDHRKLQSEGHNGFGATETVIRPGHRVQVEGKLVKSDDGFRLRSKTVKIVSEHLSPTERNRQARDRRKKKNKKKG